MNYYSVFLPDVDDVKYVISKAMTQQVYVTFIS